MSTMPPLLHKPTSRGSRHWPGRAAPGADRAREIAALQALWQRQKHHAAAIGLTGPDIDYLHAHFNMGLTLVRHLRVVDLLVPYIRGRVLEWGCRHGLDSCVYRMRLGGAVELFGCDVCDGDDYRPFHEFSGLRYARLQHPYLLDYDAASFDVVTSNGVLEHVPDDEHSVAEVARVLRPGGIFAITCLPNWLSYTEALQRARRANAHDRLYSLRKTRALLFRHGFEVVEWRRLFMVPTMLHGMPRSVKSAYQKAARLVWAANGVLERAWPLSLFASNLMVVGRKAAG